jgi:xanthine dehydrogenase accessory factor
MSANPLFPIQVAVRGAGDLGSGVIHRLHRAGFPVTVLELPQPLLVRRAVAYGSAVFEGAMTVEGITARLARDVGMAKDIREAGNVPILIDPEGTALKRLKPSIIVDARMAKRNLGTTTADAPLVVALGPGFTAGVDCHAVIETNRGHFLGRVIWEGEAEPDTRLPGDIGSIRAMRVLRAPRDGTVRGLASIGDMVTADQPVAVIDGEDVLSPFTGVLRGLLHDGIPVTAGLKIGDVDPRGVREHCFTISEKALAIGGGVLEAILASNVVREQLGR